MQIKVIHKAFEDTATHVATVSAPHAVVTEALEFAYRYTNNIDGSWSMKIGSDANDAVEVVAPLYTDADGKQWGHRSTSMGDHMQAMGKTYEVASIGFREVEPKEVDFA